jgi:Uma2 family endonuclease
MVPLLPMFAGMMARARETAIGRTQGMHMALKSHRWTRADLDRMPNDTNRYEVIRGELFVSPVPRPAHATLVYELRRLLDAYSDRENLGVRAVENTGFVAEDSEALPDIALRRLDIPPSNDWADVAIPLLVVEVTSRSTKRYDEIKKRPYYLENAIPEYWIVDGETRTIRLLTPTGERTESEILRWHPTGASSPLELNLVDFFERALGPGTA